MKVEPFDEAGDALAPLVDDSAFKPYRWTNVADDKLNALQLARIRQTAGRDGARSWVARDAGGLVGLATIEPLPWDSKMLAMSAGRAELLAAGDYASRRKTFDCLIQTVLRAGSGVRHLSVRVDAADDAAIHALESAGFLSVDALLTFERGVATVAESGAPSGFTIRTAREEDVAPIERMAACSFVDGRFHADPSVPQETAESIYREWAGACCRGTASDAVLVAEGDGGDVLGFVACRTHPETGVHLSRLAASIVLIATAPDARRRGVGRAIVTSAVEWAAARGAAAILVGTQIRNTGAARLYEGCGFRLVAGSQTFRAMVA
jgi:dTDP-4-amino-4,6-dideoxy-D-galactose acyltransferase